MFIETMRILKIIWLFVTLRHSDLMNVKPEEYIMFNLGYFNLWSNQKLVNQEVPRINKTKQTTLFTRIKVQIIKT